MLSSGIITDYTTDVMGRITDLVHYQPEPAPGSPEATGNNPASFLDNSKLAEFHYTYLADGNRDSAVETFWDTTTGTSQTTNIHWTYDAPTWSASVVGRRGPRPHLSLLGGASAGRS